MSIHAALPVCIRIMSSRVCAAGKNGRAGQSQIAAALAYAALCRDHLEQAMQMNQRYDTLEVGLASSCFARQSKID